MCLAVPLKIKEISGCEAVCERDGISRKARIDFIKEPKVGDYVLIHAGFAIERINGKQAEEDMAAARELEEELRKIAGAG